MDVLVILLCVLLAALAFIVALFGRQIIRLTERVNTLEVADQLRGRIARETATRPEDRP